MIFYHGTTEENWKLRQEEKCLFGRRYVLNDNGSILKEVSRCTYLALDKNEAEQYGDVVLEVNYNPYDEKWKIRKDKRGYPLNNYSPDSWQLRVYEPIGLNNIKRIK